HSTIDNFLANRLSRRCSLYVNAPILYLLLVELELTTYCLNEMAFRLIRNDNPFRTSYDNDIVEPNDSDRNIQLIDHMGVLAILCHISLANGVRRNLLGKRAPRTEILPFSVIRLGSDEVR